MRLALMLMFILAPAAAGAQAKTDYKEAFAIFAQSRAYVAALTKAVKVADGRNRPYCERRKIVREKDFRVERLSVNKTTGKPVSGYWGELVVVQGCDAPLPYRVWFFLGARKALYAFAAVPGETRADAFQMRLAMRQVFRVTKQTVTGCDNVRFRTTKLMPGGGERQWVETWQAQVCGIPRNFEVAFHQTSDDTRKTVVRARILR